MGLKEQLAELKDTLDGEIKVLDEMLNKVREVKSGLGYNVRNPAKRLVKPIEGKGQWGVV